MNDNEVKQDNIKAIRNFMIKSVKRYMMDMDLMKNVILQNKHAFDTSKELLKQYDKIKKDFKDLLEYNFYPVEIEDISE